MKHHVAWLGIAALVAAALTCPVLADETGPTQSSAPVTLIGPSHFLQSDGGALYRAACQVCHMPDAQGGSGAASYPALAHDPRLAAGEFPIVRVLHGSKAMPSFAALMSDAQVAAVVSYVRTHFGNDYKDKKDKVGADQVRSLRAMGP
jgi:mono/diheme cytochrome c family protein